MQVFLLIIRFLLLFLSWKSSINKNWQPPFHILNFFYIDKMNDHSYNGIRLYNWKSKDGGDILKYEAIFQPIHINSLTMPNRIMMGSMHIGLEGEEDGLNKIIAFYKRRAEENVGLIVTGGAAVSPEGSGGSHFMSIYHDSDINHWRSLTSAIHDVGGRIALQLFHAGRYAYKDLTGLDPVAPSAIKSPINPDTPIALTEAQIEKTIEDFAKAAFRAKEAGFDAVEIMGSEGYLINQFISPVTNRRQDSWGGSLENRLKFPIAVLQAVRAAVGAKFPILFRMSGIDLIENSTTEEETLYLAQELEKHGADALNIGIGWHESKVPTISMKVPRLHFIPVAEKIKKAVSIPIVGSNRVNNPADADKILEEGKVDIVSMARPFLADPAIITKALEERGKEINTCIACNQACLDHIFDGKTASCLVNPEAGRELTLKLEKASSVKKILIIGAGPAGLEAARTAAERGHLVTIVDEKTSIGGQLNYSKLVPGKTEFYETLRYYQVQLDKLGVKQIVNHTITPDDPLLQEADEIIVAVGITPRTPDIPGIKEQEVLSYRDVFEGYLPKGKEIVIIGGGGIACDLSLFLREKGDYSITLVQRGKAFARGIGKTTRWATLMELHKKGIKMIGGATYHQIQNKQLFISIDQKDVVLTADTFITASGQLPNAQLYQTLATKYPHVHLIGGARAANGLDAKKAIYEGTMLGRTL